LLKRGKGGETAHRFAYLLAGGKQAAELERFLLTWARLPDRVKRLMIMQAETYDALAQHEDTEDGEDGNGENDKHESEG
jgi:hypothetical protein